MTDAICNLNLSLLYKFDTQLCNGCFRQRLEVGGAGLWV